MGKAFLPVGVGLGVYYCYESRVGGFTLVSGGSMQPTFNDYMVTGWEKEEYKHAGTRNSALCNDIVYYERDFTLARGDVVLLKDPTRNNKLIKRVVGLEGDTVTPLGPNKEEREALTLGEGEVWVESDHAGFGYRD